jgi:hypothetical protein
MPPKKIIHKSRPVGGKKRGRPPGSKNKPNPQDTPAPTSTAPSKPVDSPAPTNGNGSNGKPANAAKPALATNTAQSFTGLSQVNNALTFPKFDPNSYFAPDLFTDSSPLNRTTKEKADEMVQSIEEKRQTVRVATANIQLNQDVVKAGNEYLKLEGLAIDYATTGVNNETKFVNYQVAGVNKEIAINKFDQAQERLTQGQLTLAGMQSITPLISQEWEARKSLKLSQISSLKIEATKAKEALEPKMTQLSQNFRQELEELN